MKHLHIANDLLVYFNVFLDGVTRFFVDNKCILEHVANNARLNLMACFIEFTIRKLQNNRRRSVREIGERK